MTNALGWPAGADAEALPADEDIDERYMVPGLTRGLALLQLFSRQKSEQKLTEIAERLGLSRSAAYRLVYTLEKDGFLRRDANTRRYRLTAKVLSLGFEFLYAQPLTDIAQPFLRKLSDLTRATAYLVVLDGWEAVHLAKVAPAITLITNLHIGSRFPAHMIVSGRIILAFSDPASTREIYRRLKAECKTAPVPDTFEAFSQEMRADRARGVCLRRSAYETALSAAAAPIRDREGKPVAAIAVVAPHAFVDDVGGAEKLGAILIDVASEFSRRAGFAG